MKRRLFNLAAAVSLVLCAAVVALWVRSRQVVEYARMATCNLAGAMSMGADCRIFIIPLWLVAALATIAPLKELAGRVRERTRSLRVLRGR